MEKVEKIRLGSIETILRPRGSMEKESLGLTIFERLDSAIGWWTRSDYAETPPLSEVLAAARENLLDEVAAAWGNILVKYKVLPKEVKTSDS